MLYRLEFPNTVYSSMKMPDLSVAKMQVAVIYCSGEMCQHSMPNEVK